jgi:hypothetical protein
VNDSIVLDIFNGDTCCSGFICHRLYNRYYHYLEQLSKFSLLGPPLRRGETPRVGGGSVLCNNSRRLFHLKCTLFPTLSHYTSNWHCSLCLPLDNTSAPQIHSRTPVPHSLVRYPALPLLPGPLPGPPSPPRLVSPSRPQASTPPTRHQNLTILQLNIDGLSTKHVEFKQYMHSNRIHVAIIQETRLWHSHKIPSIPNHSAIRQDWSHGESGGLITYIHHNIAYLEETQHIRFLIQVDRHSRHRTTSISIQTAY